MIKYCFCIFDIHKQVTSGFFPYEYKRYSGISECCSVSENRVVFLGFPFVYFTIHDLRFDLALTFCRKPA